MTRIKLTQRAVYAENKQIKFVLKQCKKLLETYEDTIEEQNEKLEKIRELNKDNIGSSKLKKILDTIPASQEKE